MGKKIFWIVRLSQIAAILCLFAIIAFQFNSLQNESNGVRYQQTEKFSYSLTNLAAAEASRYLAQQNQEDLKLLIDDLSDDPIVRDATIYDEFGKIIYQSEQVLPLPELLQLNDEGSHAVDGVIPHIAELYSDQTKIGYIRVTLEQGKILSLIETYQERGLSILSLLTLLAFIAGMLLTIVCYKRVNIIYKQSLAEIPKLIERTKSEAAKWQKTEDK
ncbi:AhpA/YtjB family protein [Psychromonas sp. 14N.309.X.WAT.B.A12]|uniref:AhpA/YtjB family protein n=1 Tax=unclassified Psychromonas TaxID=2614957 RepID=UPI0025AF9626|nr:AhpA/YtjB family protein [Psychromonas sp. 14N.309.X.WAT.B.A12]MDN2663235.1 AhpA/YtjB family protein [Psychromonas sp. 14N.309.X.WAT.B.A12]